MTCLRIKVISGVHRHAYGYLPRTMVHDYGRKRETFGMVADVDLIKTGISYGAYKTPFYSHEDGTKDLDKGGYKSPFNQDKRCQWCNGKRKAHVVWESTYAEDLVTKLYEMLHPEGKGYQEFYEKQMLAFANTTGKKLTGSGLEKQAKAKTNYLKALPLKPTEQVMLGVLVVEGSTPWAAYSGVERFGAKMSMYSDELKWLDTGDTYFDYVCKLLGMRPAPMVKEGDDLYGRNNKKLEFRAISACAAVKMLQAANQNSEKVLSMSEVWFDPGKAHMDYHDKHTIESCNKCRYQLPAMLCPDNPLEFQLQIPS